MKTRKSISHSGIGQWVLQVSLTKLPQCDPGGIATMWIDTAGTLPAGSQLTVLPSARLSYLVSIDSCSTVPSNQQLASIKTIEAQSHVWRIVAEQSVKVDVLIMMYHSLQSTFSRQR
ncbi:hypothetical protein BASA83_008213 [Batrachochytrium salamandrivorans]|nr:hypothetical protein BASA83_008213 [Batrachochytrium salamandrivorans]